MDDCPVHCVNIACRDPDFIEKHNAFILTLVGIVGTGCGVLLNYFMRSRCTDINLCGLKCKRIPMNVSQTDIEIINHKK